MTELKRIPDEVIEELRKNSCVKSVYTHIVVLKVSFHQELYQQWKAQPSINTIRDMLEANGIDPELLGNAYLDALEWDFRTNGDPLKEGWSRSRKESAEERRNKVVLVSTGTFTASQSHLKWAPAFKREIQEQFPETSIEKSLLQAGIPPELVGTSRISNLKQTFYRAIKRLEEADKQAEGSQAEESGKTGSDIYRYLANPYVLEVSGKSTVTMNEYFFNEAYSLRSLPLDRILKIYGIDPGLLSTACRSQILTCLRGWVPTGQTLLIRKGDVQSLRIQAERLHALDKMAEERWDTLRKMSRRFSPLQKKRLCLQLSVYPTKADWGCGLTMREILKKAGMSKSTYYRALYDPAYGRAEAERKEKDALDLEKIIYVMEYKGFGKGVRQIYMLLPDLCGVTISMGRIRRLLRREGIITDIRRPNPSRQRMGRFMEGNRKPNLLKRRFRLHRPNEIRLTDVTYLDYGKEDEKNRAYASSCIDPVTGKVLVFHISGNNDLELALGTLEKLSAYPAVEGALFHSDQGILYFTDEFQKKVSDMGMVQSMSKKGNCWDNAPQESFFGHFKDECDYKGCGTLEELQAMVDGYAWYYNHERRQWDRNRMTPVRYEEYLLSLDEEAFAQYMATEQEKYDRMKEKAQKLAVARVKDLGV